MRNPLDTPLAERARPTRLDQVVGQTHLLGANAPLSNMVKNKHLPSLILHGEAGVGKTTLARILAREVGRPFESLSAISSGVKELRSFIEAARKMASAPVLFIDEIHRFNKAQQDALLGAVEQGVVTLIGATTENPSFSINNALLSRSQTYRLNPLSAEELTRLLERATASDPKLQSQGVTLVELNKLIELSSGDARRALNLLEMSAEISAQITNQVVASVAQSTLARYDKDSDAHYDTISAMIKSVRGSDPDAALYWMALMLSSGEDPRFIARRLVILASEDIGNANPNALLIADAAMRSVAQIGMPEARIILGQALVYLATSPKSNATYNAINSAMSYAAKHQHPVPLHLRNGVTQLMKQEGYGQGYLYPHDHPNHYVKQQYAPDALVGTRFYTPADNPREQQSKQWLEALKSGA